MARIGPDHLLKAPRQWVDHLLLVAQIRDTDRKFRGLGLDPHDGLVEEEQRRCDEIKARILAALEPESAERDAIGISRSSFANVVEQEMMRASARKLRNNAVRRKIMDLWSEASSVSSEG